MGKDAILQALKTGFSGENIDYKQIIRIIVPILIDQSFLVLMSMFNVAMISSAGVTAISAVNMVDAANMFLINVFYAVATGGSAIVAQYKGSGNREMVKKTASQAVSVTAVFAFIIFLLLLLFHNQVLSFLFGSAEPKVFQYAKLYLIGNVISYPFLAIYQGVYASLIGAGETKRSLMLSVILNFTYTILNVIFIKLLHMSVMGLVISVILARFIGMMVALVYITHFNQTVRFSLKDVIHLDLSIIKKILVIGIPFALEQTFFNGGKLLTQTFIVKLGTLSLAVNAIAGSISSFYQIVPGALSIAMVTVVGQCIGQRKVDDAKKLTKSFLWLSAFVFVIVSFVIFPLLPLFMKLFAAPDAIQSSIFTLLILSAFAQPVFWSFGFIVPSALRAAGDAKFTSITSMLSMWLFRVTTGYLLGITFHFGIVGVWSAMFMEWGVRSLCFWLRFKGAKWYAHKLI